MTTRSHVTRAIWAIDEQAAHLERLYQRAAGEITEEVEELEYETEEARARAIDSLVQYLRECDACGRAAKDLADRYAEIQRGNKRRIEWARSQILEVLVSSGSRRIDLPTAVVSRIAGRKHVELSIPAEELPSDLQVVKVAPDTAEIMARIRSGQTVEGASLTVGPESIQVRDR
jgi:hypothetical protein